MAQASLRQEIREVLRQGLEKALAVTRSALSLPTTSLPPATLEVPREEGFGDFTTNLAFKLASRAGKPPREVAALLAEHFPSDASPYLDRLEVAGAGYLNFYLKPHWLEEALREILLKGEDYGRQDLGRRRKVNVEFVSANPTGLLHMGNARGAALGDSIAALLAFCGFEVTREYYINDAGYQIERFAASLEARYRQAFGEDVPVPPDGYHGQDLVETVKRFISEHGDRYLHTSPEERREALVRFAIREKLEAIRNSLENFGVHFDVWFSEQELHASGKVAETIEELKRRGATYEKEGALWFRASAYGAPKDDVLVRANGLPTYFAADIAYHRNKLERGFEWMINLWGADHHGHVPRLKAALQALGYDPERLTVIIMQLVRLTRGGEAVRMSKRAGEYVTLDDLLAEVGKDAARYFFVWRSADAHLDFDLELAKAQSMENPVYYIQYAHARIASLFRQLAERGKSLPPPEKIDFSFLREPEERRLMYKLALFPEEVEGAALNLAPHRLAAYLHDLSSLFHSFYNEHRIIGAGSGLEEARLGLAAATQLVLRQGLKLLGISAPERM
ncbi:arginyl-tRNA synthetase [Ammonifex degensii KC4]|uniref:Arginine--tRNA ligase n=1 Tax=Ammonifex degensii (strain DSM 10501 / KC4) TaxID=429009 RepID=C9RAB7_AMMDK|nr:arginine--tRNA ligase [Ammonifex degensii]ACX51226.1 arginyl-tRNA synthetase [Ammonifex degensii KC4]